MKRVLWILRLALFALMPATAASGAIEPGAAQPVQVGSPVFGGAACSSTVTRVVPGEDGVSVIGEMKPKATHAGGKSSKSVSTEACDVTVPIEVAKGFQAALTGAKFEGSYQLPSGARASLRTERFVAGGAGLKHEQELVAPSAGLSGNYESEMTPEEAVWTSCNGGGYNLRSSTRLILENGGKAKPAQISIGKLGDAKTEMAYKVAWRKCR